MYGNELVTSTSSKYFQASFRSIIQMATATYLSKCEIYPDQSFKSPLSLRQLPISVCSAKVQYKC